MSHPKVPVGAIVNALNIIHTATSRRAFFLQEGEIIDKTYKELTAYISLVRPSALAPKTEPSAAETQVEFEFVETSAPENVIPFPGQAPVATLRVISRQCCGSPQALRFLAFGW